jgi:tetratricopeptide (TPR) repeat protein
MQEAEKLLEPTIYEMEKFNVALSTGTLYFHQGDLAKAESYYRQAYSPYMKDVGPLYQQAMITNNLGNVYYAQGRFSGAELWLGKSIALFREANAHLMLANSLATLALTLADQGKADLIGPIFDEAMAIVMRYLEDAFAESIQRELAQVNEYLSD